MAADAEVTAADIARIAGVGRAAVSNWRRRHTDFPQPVGGSISSPLFALNEVERWLAVNGRSPSRDEEPIRRTKADEADFALLARLLVSLLPALTRGVVLDPVCEGGASLAAAVARFGAGVRYVGQCLNADDIAEVEAALAAAGARQVDLVAGAPFDDTLADYVGHAAAVISIPPLLQSFSPEDAFDHRWEFGPPSRGDAALAWVQAAYSYLKPGGVAAVAVPFGTATRSSGRRIRAELLRAGVLTDVIGLPERMVPGISLVWHVWVLRRPAGRPDYTVRMIDLSARSPRKVPTDDAAWATVFADPTLAGHVPAIQLLDDEVMLIPSMHVTSPARDVAADYHRIQDRYRNAARSLPDAPPAFAPSAPGDVSLVSVADLARAGALEVRDRRPDVQPGDVIVPFGPGRFDAITVATEPSTDQRGVTAIRCDPDQLDPYFLACFLRSEANRRQAVGTLGGTFRLDLRRARVPRIPLTDQRRYGDAFRRLLEYTARAQTIAAIAAQAIETAVYGLTAGTLAPTDKAEGNN